MGEHLSTQIPTLHMLHTCPFCWKIRSIAELLDIDYETKQINAMKMKKELKFTNGWGKVPVWTEKTGEVVVDSTPIMKHIDATYNQGKLWATTDEKRRDEWMEWGECMARGCSALVGGLSYDLGARSPRSSSPWLPRHLRC